MLSSNPMPQIKPHAQMVSPWPFLKKNMEFIKLEVMSALNHFHQQCYLVRSCNAYFIALIPKKSAIKLREYNKSYWQCLQNCGQAVSRET